MFANKKESTDFYLDLVYKLKLLFIFFSTTLILIFLSDWNGYEGDDLNSIVPMFHLNDALAGRIEIYKYYWQPLAYQLGSLLNITFSDPRAIFFIPGISIALSILVIYHRCNKLNNISFVMLFCLLMLTPEIIYTGLYYNSSSIAYLCMVSAISLTYGKPNLNTAFIIGVLLGLSILFRMEFILVTPLVLILLFFSKEDFKLPVISFIALFAVLVLSILLDVTDFQKMYDGYQVSHNELIARSNEAGWDDYTKNMVLTVAFSPLGWLFYIFGIGYVFLKQNNSERIKGGVIFISILPCLYVIKDLLSVKYLMPAFSAFPFFASYIWSVFLSDQKIKIKTKNRLKYGLIIVTFFLFVGSAEPMKNKPYMNIYFFNSDHSRVIGTHDGSRSWGSYFTEILKFRNTTMKNQDEIISQSIIKYLQTGSNKVLLFIGAQNYFTAGSSGWRHAQLTLETLGYKGKLNKNNSITFNVGGNKIILTSDVERISLKRFSSSDICVYNTYKDGRTPPICLDG